MGFLHSFGIHRHAVAMIGALGMKVSLGAPAALSALSTPRGQKKSFVGAPASINISASSRVQHKATKLMTKKRPKKKGSDRRRVAPAVRDGTKEMAEADKPPVFSVVSGPSQ